MSKQKEQYERAAEKLEDQLLKLKEQREALKLQGQKHEDTIMKENAKLQKEVKYRITYMKDYMVKIEKGLAEDDKVQAEARERKRVEDERERVWREQETRRQEQERKQNAGGKEESEEREKRKKSKKKAKSRDRSSSSSDSENDRKKKKKSKKSRSSESESSEEEGKKKRKKDAGAGMEEDMFRMVAELKSRRKKSGSGGADDVLVDLMGKMSESYSRVKIQNAELSSRCLVFEGQNKTLQKRVGELEDQLKAVCGGPAPEKKERKSRFSKIEDKEDERSNRSRNRSDSSEIHSQSKDRYHSKVGTSPPAPRLRSPPPRSPPKTKPPPPGVPVGANPNTEALGTRTRPKGTGGGLSAVLALAGGYVDPPSNMVKPPQPVAPPTMVPKPDLTQGREKSKDDDRRGSRRRRDSRSRSRSRSKERRASRRDRSRDKKLRDKNDKIDLDQWVQPPSSQKEAGMNYLKEKMREKQEGYRREEELRSRWQKQDIEEPAAPAEPPKPAYEPLAENRSSVNISWGQGVGIGRASAERESKSGGIKVAPIVGKMPWVKGTVGTNGPRKSKFGPPVEGAIPPPSMLTSQPTLVSGTEPQAQQQDWAPPPGIRTDWGPLTQGPLTQPPAWDQPPDPAAYGYGVPQIESNSDDIADHFQEVTPPPPEPPRKPSRNPKPSAPLDMEAMLAAAQQHMQKSLATKLQSIGVPVPEHYRQQAGLTNEVSSYDLPEAIPLPGDPIGVDMDIADIAIPDDAPDIPLPPGMDDDIAEPEPQHQPQIQLATNNQQEDISAPPGDDPDPAPPGEDLAPPGEEDDCRPPGED